MDDSCYVKPGPHRLVFATLPLSVESFVREVGCLNVPVSSCWCFSFCRICFLTATSGGHYFRQCVYEGPAFFLCLLVWCFLFVGVVFLLGWCFGVVMFVGKFLPLFLFL